MPPASLARSVLKPYASKPCPPNYDAPPLTTKREAFGNELPPSLPPDQKSFSDFYENLQKWSLGEKKFANFGKSAKNFFLLEKNPTSSFKIGGIFEKMSQNPNG